METRGKREFRACCWARIQGELALVFGRFVPGPLFPGFLVPSVRVLGVAITKSIWRKLQTMGVTSLGSLRALGVSGVLGFLGVLDRLDSRRPLRGFRLSRLLRVVAGYVKGVL
jgi:hypothetical protein